jgi:hypothetical protein
MAALFVLFLKLSLLLIVTVLITLFSPLPFLSLLKSRAYEPASRSPPCRTLVCHLTVFKRGSIEPAEPESTIFEIPPLFLFRSLG